MALYTLTQIESKITSLDAAIDKAEKAQAAGMGAGMSIQRGDLAAMYAERRKWLNLYESQSAAESGGSINRVKFARPL